MTLFKLSAYLLLVHVVSVAASDLPDCPQDQSQHYHNCYGTYRHNGDKYVGEFRAGVFHGQGTYYSRSDGDLIELDGLFLRSEGEPTDDPAYS